MGSSPDPLPKLGILLETSALGLMQKRSRAALTINGDVWVPVAVLAMWERQPRSLQHTRLCSKGVFNCPRGRREQPVGWEQGGRREHRGEYHPADPAALPYALAGVSGEYILGVAYRAYPTGHGDLGWAGDDALGECPRKDPCIPSSHPASPCLQ